jgi:hypothetical protein
VKASLHKRLTQLEEVRAAELKAERDRAQQEEGRSFSEKIREMLRVNGFQPGPDESLASAFARFLGISYQELKIRLAERAASRL